MSANADTIWRIPAYLPYLQPPLDDQLIASAERKIGYKLPVEYLELLYKQNGGYIRFSLPEMIHSIIAGIGPHFPSLTSFDWRDAQEVASIPLQGLVPFDGDGHWHICFDYRENRVVPRITYIDIECDRESRISDSFADYLGKLRIQAGDAYVLEHIPDIDPVIAKLSSVLEIKFYPRDSQSHGYPEYRASLGTPGNPQWLWISPNMVPRGFVRSTDRRYAELKNLIPGYAARFRELPANSYILNATDAVRSKIIDACRNSQFVTRPLREYIKG